MSINATWTKAVKTVRLVSHRHVRRRKFVLIHAFVRSTIQRRLYRRSFRPSWYLVFREARWGAIRSMPCRRRRSWRALLSYARSATSRGGFLLGRPGPGRGTRTLRSVASARVASPDVAAQGGLRSVGRCRLPPPRASYLSLYASGRRRDPPFGGGERRVDEALFPAEDTLVIEPAEVLLPDVLPHAPLLPHPEAAPAPRGRGVLRP